MPPLRGSGSQSYSQVNGTKNGNTSTTYASGAVGAVQGDASRNIAIAPISANTWVSGIENGASHFFHDVSPLAPFYAIPRGVDSGDMRRRFSIPWVYYSNADYDNSFSISSPSDILWRDALKKYRYTLVSSSSTSGSGEDAVTTTTYSLVEKEENPQLEFPTDINWMGLDLGLSWPVDNEFRPVNIAVRYFIRAR